jgi:hypothetical protein
MKTFKMSKKLLPILLLPLANVVIAKTEPFSVGFTTLPEIGINLVTAMDFGAVLKLGSTATCQMLANATNTLGTASVEKAGTSALNGLAASLAGTCAGGDAGTLGVYEVTGLAGNAVTIILTGETNTDIQFEPAGYTWNFNGGAYLTLDDSVTGVGMQLAAGSDGTANVTPGLSRLILGGTITNQRALTAGETVSANFDISVNY